MANGSLFGDIKSKLGLGAKGNGSYDDYDEYDEYGDDYYGDYDDGYESRDPYMDRSTVTTRSSRGARSDAGLPRLVSMDDARASARTLSRGEGSTGASGMSGVQRTSSIRSYGRTMVDSSLPPTMTAEGAAAVSAASNRRAGGLESLFGSGGSSSSGSSAASSSSLGSARSGSSAASSDILRDSMQLSMPGQRKLQVIKPTKYENAEAVTNVLKGGDVAILSFGTIDRDLMKRILDFSFGAASAMDATVECIANGVFAICRSAPLDEREREDLHNMGIA